MRVKGEGTIWKRSDGRFAGRIQFENKNYDVTGKTRKEVADKLRDKRKQLEAGIVVDARSMKLATFLDKWYASAKPRLAYKTQLSYEKAIERLKDGLGQKQIGKLRPDEVQTYLDGLAATPRAQQITRNVLRTALNQAVKWQYLERNPAALIDLQSRPSEPQSELWNHAQVQQFLAAIAGHRWEALFWLALYLGLRRGEVLGLEPADIDLEGKKVTVRRSLDRHNGEGLVKSTTKTAGSTRSIPIPPFVRPVLVKHLAGVAEGAQVVFSTGAGTPIEPSNLRREFIKLQQAAKVPVIHFHALRHLAATELIRAGVDVSAAAAILGHARPTTTLDLYSHAFDEAKIEAMGRLEARHRAKSTDKSADGTKKAHQEPDGE